MKYVIITIILLFNLSCSIAQSLERIINYNDVTKAIGGELDILVDSNSTLSFKQVLKSNNFKKSTTSFPNLGISNYSYWIRFIIKNNSKSSNLAIQIDESTIDYIKFYQFSNNLLIKTNYSGSRVPLKNRLVIHQSFIYPIKISSNDTSFFYLHLKSGKQLILPIYVGTEEQIFESTLLRDLLFGTYLGVMIVMILYNIFIYSTVKDTNYIYYVLYLIIVALTQAALKGYLFRFFLPNYPIIADQSIYITSAILGLAAIEFSKNFLSSATFTPLLHKCSYIFWVIYAYSILSALLGRYNTSYTIILVSAMVSAVYVLYMAIIITLNGSRSAKYFLIAWSSFIVCVVVFVLKGFNILPYNNLTDSSLLFGSAIEATLLSFALADKINIYKKEKEISQAATLSVLEENDRIIREQNSTLERKVKERTNELVATNKNLNKTLTDLKEAQTQLVEAEKMASLGQLTAGIAHEINNPINFVTSNVGPLKRDVDILVDAIANMEFLGLSNASIDEKQQQIDDYKEKIDLDYLKLEIGQLINGIHEGAKRTADIVKGLKIFSRLDEDDLKKADINEGINSTLTIANNLIGNKIQIIRNMDDLPLIECYPGKLNQVFLNIISNAVFAIQEKFDNQTGGILKISTSYDETYLTIKVEDNGTGMSEATKQKIFEPFFTTKNVGVGTGLGMSIVYNTIKKHNAKIYLNSTEGVGTEFVIQLNLVFTEPIADYQSEQQG